MTDAAFGVSGNAGRGGPGDRAKFARFEPIAYDRLCAARRDAQEDAVGDRMLMGFQMLLAIDEAVMVNFLAQAFYPLLLLVFVIASLGLPIPEDIPLIAAGIILRTQPEVASWPGALTVSLIGIMSGDIILYSLGRRWGSNVFSHRSVRWIMTPQRMEMMTEKFHRYGVWMCFFGRFMMGVRAVMCMTAGVTRFPFWKFFLADFCGALLSVPFFIVIGYAFAGMLPQLEAYIKGAKWIVLGLVALVTLIIFIRGMRKTKRSQVEFQQTATPPTDAPPAAPDVPAAKDAVVRPRTKVEPA
jgi:membrane protein DedA with SNARE-associated domain